MPDALRPTRYLMSALAFLVPLVLLIALILFSLLPQNTTPLVHGMLAVGIMPLIMGAMIYFTPVLTHSRAPAWPVLLLPGLALAAGALAAASIFWWRNLIFMAALLGLLAAGGLFGWIGYRAHTMLGRPHPNLLWYLLGLISLFAGLLAMAIAAWWPEHWLALRRFHLHMNIFGFIGLSAVGTLRVLLPTAAGYTDATAGEHLRRDLYPMALGAWLMATGAAWWNDLAWIGLLLWLIPVARLAVSVLWRWRKQVWGWHRPATSLGLALIGLVMVLASGGLHTLGTLPADLSLPLFFYMFLFPLVTGAISYLLPVWLWPARNTSAYATAVQRLTRGSGARALVFFMAGILAWNGVPGAIFLAGASLAVFLVQLLWALSARFSGPV